MKTHCNIILDLLPLYYDEVCSPESKELVEQHLCTCPRCQKELQTMGDELVVKHKQSDDNEMAKAVSSAWKKGKNRSFIKGIAIAIAVLVLFISCFVYPYTKAGVSTFVTVWEAPLTAMVESKLTNGNNEGTTSLLWYRVTVYPNANCVYFIGSGYSGFFYSADGEPVGFQGTDATFVQHGQGWIWRESTGDNWMYAEQIIGNWYWYEMHF